MKKKTQPKATIIRHSLIEIAEHWVLALSGFALVFSGFGQMPIYKRYWIARIPGLQWSGDYQISLTIHYIAAAFFIGAIIFHLLYHGLLKHYGLLPRKGDIKESIKTIKAMLFKGEEPPFDKYLPEQRLAYLYMGAVILVLVITGIVKVYKNFPHANVFSGLIFFSTWTHTIFTLLFIIGLIAHVGALLIKVNFPLAKSIFHGKVEAEYAKERHPLWFKKLSGNK
jgi:formate dehydrogenase gamma subunit